MKSNEALKPIFFGLLVSFLSVGCKGPTGAPGAPGAGKIVSTMNCAGPVSSGVLQGIEVEYDAVLTSSGDVYATAVVIDDVYNRIQASGTAFYAANQNGAQNGLVLITADAYSSNNGGYWAISLNRSTLVTSIRYTDPDLQNPINLVFNPAACKVQYF